MITTYNIPPHVSTDLLNVQVVEVILYELNTRGVISLVELVGNVPAERAELSSLLHCRVEEGDGEQQRLPLSHVDYVEEILCRIRGEVKKSKLFSLFQIIGLHPIERVIKSAHRHHMLQV